jgi:hypothetical protein
MDFILLSNELYPNTIDLNKYGILITKNYEYINNIGKLYQYSNIIQILVIDNYKDNKLIRNCILFKNKKEILRYSDYIYNNSNTFIRNVNNNILTYDLNGNLLIKESLIKCKYLTNEKRELVQDIKYLVFDIECYLDKNNIFKAYSCGYSDGINVKLYY